MAGKITPEIADEVCRELALGESSLRKICSAKGFTASAFIQRTYDDETLAKQYARALDACTDVEFEELRDELKEVPPTVEGRVDPGWVQWKRTVIDTKKWSWARRTPKSRKRFGDKLDVDASVKIQRIVVRDEPASAELDIPLPAPKPEFDDAS